LALRKRSGSRGFDVDGRRNDQLGFGGAGWHRAGRDGLLFGQRIGRPAIRCSNRDWLDHELDGVFVEHLATCGNASLARSMPMKRS